MLDGRFVLTHPIKFEKNPGIDETDIKMLNCIPWYEVQRDKLRGQDLRNKPPTHPCTNAPSPKCTNAPMNYFRGLLIKY